MNYAEAIEYIHSINWTFCNPGLGRIRTLCDALGNPEKELKFVHVAGTNGKGSFCSMLDSVLRSAGYKTGLFTSPYIRFFNERICFDGNPITDDDLAEITSFIRPIADAMQEKPTEFELITAIGFEYFRRKKCDVVILEAGMGGRLDSTNIIESHLLSVITGIAFDHTAFLGDTIEKIANVLKVTPSELGKYNDFGKLYLKANQTISVPKTLRTYKIAPGDTLTIIMEKTGLSAMEILELNANNWLKTDSIIYI